MSGTLSDLNPGTRVLLGPGPSAVPPRVLRAMATPLVGHLDPDFIQILSEIRRLVQFAFQTSNPLSLAISGTGTAAMEAALSNLIQPGDRVLACVQGFFGERLAEMAGRYGGRVERLERPWGHVFDPDQVAAAVRSHSPRLVTLVHAETSTGALQPEIAAIAAACHATGALLILDCVTSLGALPVEIDAWDVDVAYSAGQKGLSAPPGLSPITVGERAREAIAARSAPPPVFYFDLNLLGKYWSDTPAYHHTAPISTAYALREALRLVEEEGLPARFERHAANAKRLWAGLEALDVALLVEPAHRLVSLTTPRIPSGWDEAGLRRRLLSDYGIEIAGGFGPLAGKIWRIGLMGHSCQQANVVLLLAALEELLRGPSKK
jgi:alanine-glyoxylate transaminase/serine-glyoxylate transaminase/serine-pyruvate transaminase